MMKAEVTPEQIDERCLAIIKAMGGGEGGPGWTVDVVDAAALMHLAALSCKGLGMPLPAAMQRLIVEWGELPDKGDLRRKMGVPVAG